MIRRAIQRCALSHYLRIERRRQRALHRPGMQMLQNVVQVNAMMQSLRYTVLLSIFWVLFSQFSACAVCVAFSVRALFLI
jgi:hypothetical protein